MTCKPEHYTEAAVAMASVREREIDLPKGAGPAGRHEPGGAAVASTSGTGGGGGGRRMNSILGVLGMVGVAATGTRGQMSGTAAATSTGAGTRAGAGVTSGGGDQSASAARLAGAEKAAADAALLRLLPPSERPLIDQAYVMHAGPSIVPRPVRQTTLDRLVAAALRAEVGGGGWWCKLKSNQSVDPWLA